MPVTGRASMAAVDTNGKSPAREAVRRRCGCLGRGTSITRAANGICRQGPAGGHREAVPDPLLRNGRRKGPYRLMYRKDTNPRIAKSGANPLPTGRRRRRQRATGTDSPVAISGAATADSRGPLGVFPPIGQGQTVRRRSRGGWPVECPNHPARLDRRHRRAPHTLAVKPSRRRSVATRTFRGGNPPRHEIRPCGRRQILPSPIPLSPSALPPSKPVLDPCTTGMLRL